jgi:flavin prenyltransferase
MVNEVRHIAVGITGASGSIYAKQVLDVLCASQDIQVHIVMSKNAKDVWQYELGNDSFAKYNAKYYEQHDFTASFASGSSRTESLVIVPCSMGTLGRIAAGISDTLTTRAADVMMKERRKLILVARETPLNAVQLQNMLTLTNAGAIVCPAMPSYYSKPQSLEEAAFTVSHRVLSLLGVPCDGYRWGED